MSLQDYKKRDEPYTPQQEALMDILIQVESGGDDNAVGDKGKALGSLQIWKNYWFDATERSGLGGRYKDVTDRDYAKAVMNAYMIRYAGPAWSDPERFDPEKVARIHNGGPKGHSERKEFTNKYWKKVEPRLEELPFDLTGGKTDTPRLEDWLAERRETERILVSSKPNTINLADEDPVIVDEPKEVFEFPPHPDGPIKLPPVEDLDATVAEGSPYKIEKTVDLDWSKYKGIKNAAWAGTSPEDPIKDSQNPFSKGGVGDFRDPIGDMVLNLLGFESKQEIKDREARNAARIKETGGKPTVGGFIELSPELSQGQDLVFETLKHHLESGMSLDILKNLITGEDNISRKYKPDPEFSWDNHQKELEELSKVFPSDGFSESIQNSKSLKEAQARAVAASGTLNLYKKQGEYFGTDGWVDTAQTMAFNVGFGLIDPINVAPVGGVMAAGKLAGRFVTGATTGARAARIAIQGGAGAAEGMLWAKAYSERSDPLRADPHYGIAAGVGTFLGVGLGALGERRGPTQKRLYEGFQRKVESAPNTLVLDNAGKVVGLSPRTTAAGIWNKYTPKEKVFWVRENIKRRGLKIDSDRLPLEIDGMVKSMDNEFGVDPKPSATTAAPPETPSMVAIDVEGTEAFATAREAEFEFLHQEVIFDDSKIDPIVVEQLRDLVEEANSGKVISKQDIDAAVSPPEQGAGFRLVDDTKPVVPDASEPKKDPSLFSQSTEFKRRNSKDLNKENFSRRIEETKPLRPRKDTLFLITRGREPIKITEPVPFGTFFAEYRGVKKNFDKWVEKTKSYGPISGELNPTDIGMISRQLPSKFVTIFLPLEAQKLVKDPMKFITALIETNELGGKLKLPKATHDGLVDIKFNMAKEMDGNKDLSDRVSFLPQTGGKLDERQVREFGHRITQFLVEQGFDGFTFLTNKGKASMWSVFQPEVLFTPDFRRPDYLVNFGDQLPKPKTVLAKEAIEDIKKAITDKYSKIKAKNPPVEDVNSLKVIEKKLDEKLKQDKLDREDGGLFDGFDAMSEDVTSLENALDTQLVRQALGMDKPVDAYMEGVTLKDFFDIKIGKWFDDLLAEGDGSRMGKFLGGGDDKLLEGIMDNIVGTLKSKKKKIEDRTVILQDERTQLRRKIKEGNPESGALIFDNFLDNAVKDWVIKTFVKDGQLISSKESSLLNTIVGHLKSTYGSQDIAINRSIRRINAGKAVTQQLIDKNEKLGKDVDPKWRQSIKEFDEKLAEANRLLEFHKDMVNKTFTEQVGFVNDELMNDMALVVRKMMADAEQAGIPLDAGYPVRSKIAKDYDESFTKVASEAESTAMASKEAEIKKIADDLVDIENYLTDMEQGTGIPDLASDVGQEVLKESVFKFIKETSIKQVEFKDFDDFFESEISRWFTESFVKHGQLLRKGIDPILDTLLRRYIKDAEVDLEAFGNELKSAKLGLKENIDLQQESIRLGRGSTKDDEIKALRSEIKILEADLERIKVGIEKVKKGDVGFIADPDGTFLKGTVADIEIMMAESQVAGIQLDPRFPNEAEIKARWDAGPTKFDEGTAESVFPDLEAMTKDFNERQTQLVNDKIDKFYNSLDGIVQIPKLEKQHFLPEGSLTRDLIKKLLKREDDINDFTSGINPAVLKDMLDYFTKLTGKGIRALKNVFKKIKEFFIGIPRGNNKGSFDLGGIFGAGRKKRRVIKNDFLDQWGKDETGLIPSLPLKKLINWSRSRRARTQSNEVGLIRVLGQWAYGSERFRIDGSDEITYAGARSDRVSIQQGIVKNRMKSLGDFKTRMVERQKESTAIAKELGFENAEAMNEEMTSMIFEIANMIGIKMGDDVDLTFPDANKKIAEVMAIFLKNSNLSEEGAVMFNKHFVNLVDDLQSLRSFELGDLKEVPFLDGSPLLNWSLFRDLNQVVDGEHWLGDIIREVITVDGEVTKSFITAIYQGRIRNNQNLEPIELTKSISQLVTTEVLDRVNEVEGTAFTKKDLIDQIFSENKEGVVVHIDTGKEISSLAINPDKVKNNLEGVRLQENRIGKKMNADKTEIQNFSISDLMSHDLFDTLDDLGTAIIDNNLQKDIFEEFQATLKGFKGIEGIPKDIKTVRGMFDYLEKNADELSKRGAITDRKEFDTMLALLRADLTGDRPPTKLHNSVVTLQKVASATSVLGFSLPAFTEALLPIVRNIPRSAKRLVNAASKLDEEGSIDFVRSAGVGTDSALFANTGSNRKSVIFDDTNPMSISKKPDLEVGPDSRTKKARRKGGNMLDKAQNTMANFPLIGLMKVTAYSQKMAFNSIVSRILDRVGKFKGETITKDNIKDIIDPKIAAQMGWNPQDSVAIFNAIRDSFARNPNATTKHGLGANVYSLDMLFGDMDVATKERFSAGLYSWVGQNIVRPDMGDLPLFLNNSFMKVLGQFRGFGIAQYSKFTGPLIQRGLNPSTDAMGPLAFLGTTMIISAAYNMLNYSLYNEDEGEDDFKRLKSGRKMKNNLSNAMFGGFISPLVGPAEFAFGMPMDMLGIHYGTEWYDKRYGGKYGPIEDMARQSAAVRIALDIADPAVRVLKKNTLEGVLDGKFEGPFNDPVLESDKTREWFGKMSGFHKMIKLLQLFDVVSDYED